MSTVSAKQSYTIPCSSSFRDSITALAHRRSANVADLVRSVVLVVPPELVAATPDPGGPNRNDRETVRVKSGPAKGRPWRRKPRLQARMAPGHEVPMLRRALALALAMEQGQVNVRLDGLDAAATVSRSEEPPPAPGPRDAEDEELARLRAIVSVLAFEPLAGGVHTREDALHVLGFRPGARPGLGALRARFRMLAAIHHPDSGYGDHDRMSQLNSAMERLRRDPGG